MIDLSINKVGLEHNIQKAKENHIIIPTIAQMQNPDLIPEKIKAKLTITSWTKRPGKVHSSNSITTISAIWKSAIPATHSPMDITPGTSNPATS